MRSVVFPQAARILGVLAVVLGVGGLVSWVFVTRLDTWPLFAWLLLGGGVVAVVALVFASQAEPRGAGKRPAIVALILVALPLGFLAILFSLSGSGG